MFEEAPGGVLTLKGGETETVECKAKFGLGSKVMRSVAALANNQGGYILFGVSDTDYRIIGTDNSKISGTDISIVSVRVGSCMEPCPKVEFRGCQIADCHIGVMYVFKENDGPVISTKTDQEFREGTIYYRYQGESRAIRPAEFRKILSERDRRQREVDSRSIAQLLALGPRAQVIDIGSNTPVATKIVREGIDDGDVLRNFIRREKVESPLAYLLRSSNTPKRWLPIFYYLGLSGLSVGSAIRLIEDKETSFVASKRSLIQRLKGEMSAYAPAVGRLSNIFLEKIRNRDNISVKSTDDAIALMHAFIALQDGGCPIEYIFILLADGVSIVRDSGASKGTSWSVIYRAAARIDEIYFSA
jgi:hypothetical protein